MSNYLIILVALIYTAVGVDLSLHNKIGMGICFLAYAIANIGLYLANKGL